MQHESQERPIICRLDAFTAPQARRHKGLWGQIERRVAAIEEQEEGYRIRFPLDDGLFVLLAEFVTLERLCCPFLDFAIELMPVQDIMHLTLSGGEGVKEFLRLELKVA